MVRELEYGQEGFPSQLVKIGQPVLVFCLIPRTLQAKIVVRLAEVLWWGSHE